MSLLSAGFSGALYFNDTNVTDFLKTWKTQCQNHDLSEKSMIQCSLFYCNDLIVKHIKSLSEFEPHNWEKLKEQLCKDYLQQNLKQQYYSWVYLSQYKQMISKKNLHIYCIQFWAIASWLIKKKKLNEYTACLWFLEELSEKRQAKIVRQADIKTMISSMFSLNETLKTAEKIYNEKESLSMLWEYQDSTESLQKLIDQWCEETAAIVRTISAAFCQSIMSVKSVIEDLASQFKNLTLSLQTKLNHMKQMLRKVMTTISQQYVVQSYQQYSSQQASLQNYSSWNYLFTNYSWSAQQSNSQQNNQLTWNWISQQKSDCNVCWFCHEWGHHQQICPHLLHLIDDKKVHLDERLHIVWRPDESDEPLISLNSFMHQLDSVSMLLKKEEQCNQTSSRQHHKANLLELQCNWTATWKKMICWTSSSIKYWVWKTLKYMSWHMRVRINMIMTVLHMQYWIERQESQKSKCIENVNFLLQKHYVSESGKVHR